VDVEVRFAPSGRRIRVPVGTSLLEAARRAGLPVASACGAEGLCGRCGMRVLGFASAGIPAESAAEVRVKRANRVDPSQRLSCRVHLRGDLEVTADYW
jgi:uncharacterized 2Fe-2S/4Fe-4S cluster protein (DUF4445 family)